MNKSKYYAIRYHPQDSGCPIVLSGFFNCDEFEWDPFELNPMGIAIKNKYSLKFSGLEMALNELDFDYYQAGDIYVSRRFLDICDRLGAKYKAIPLDVCYEGDSRKGDFYIFLPGESLAALDKAKSVFEASKNTDTGLAIESQIYPGSINIDNITSFVISPALKGDIFRCQETLEIFCSDQFRSAASNLKGLAFEAINEHYTYDAWAEFNEI